MNTDGSEVRAGGKSGHTLAYDGWNQTAANEVCQTLRAANSQGEANDAVIKVCAILKRKKGEVR